jgi:hypothetical protein
MALGCTFLETLDGNCAQEPMLRVMVILILIIARRIVAILTRRAARGHHPINVKVGCAAILTFTTVLGGDGVCLALIGDILVGMKLFVLMKSPISSAGCMCIHLTNDIFDGLKALVVGSCVFTGKIMRPSDGALSRLFMTMIFWEIQDAFAVVIIDLRAQVVAFLVHDFSVFVHTIICATLLNQLLFGGGGNEDIHVALDLLCGRPINLAILFQTLFLGELLADLFFTATPTCLVRVLTIQEVTRLILAVVSLAFFLCAITVGVLLNVCAVRIFAI